ncbi:MAG: MFS transporter [Rhodospirillales bacterium]|nr:MFS transporter [Rhodospirillales bacterium]
MDAPVPHLTANPQGDDGPLDINDPEFDLPRFSHAEIKRVILGILLCMLMAAIDQTVVVPAVPAIAADLGGFDHLAWIVAAYLLTSTATTPIYGKLSDVFGRRALLIPAIVIFVAASCFCALSQSLMQLIAARALQGIGGAGLMTMAQSAIADVVAPRERGRYQGYMAGTWGVASVLGPILGGWMTDALSWRWIFWINLPIGILALVLSNRALKLLKPRGGNLRIDYAGAALLTTVITSFLLLMSWGGTQFAWTAPPMVGLAAAMLGLLALLVVRERVAPDPLLPPRLFVNGGISSGIAISAACSAVIFGATFLLPLFFQLARGADAAVSGTMIVPFLGTNVLGAIVSGDLCRRFGKTRGIMLGGLAPAILGFVLLASAGPGTSLGLLVAYMALLGLAIGVCMPASLVTVQSAAQRRDVGAATGALLFLRAMGGAFGSTLVGALLTGRFASSLAAAGLPALDLGTLRQEGGLAGLKPAMQQAARTALANGFHWSFGACAALVAVGFVVALVMPDLVLKSGETTASSPTPGPQAQPVRDQASG